VVNIQLARMEWIYPNNSTAARHLLTKYRAELIAAGALTRIDRRLTVLGAGYAIFLASKMANVPGYSIAPTNGKSRERRGAVAA
jgi:hypothetical protein